MQLVGDRVSCVLHRLAPVQAQCVNTRRLVDPVSVFVMSLRWRGWTWTLYKTASDFDELRSVLSK